MHRCSTDTRNRARDLTGTEGATAASGRVRNGRAAIAGCCCSGRVRSLYINMVPNALIFGKGAAPSGMYPSAMAGCLGRGPGPILRQCRVCLAWPGWWHHSALEPWAPQVAIRPPAGQLAQRRPCLSLGPPDPQAGYRPDSSWPVGKVSGSASRL